MAHSGAAYIDIAGPPYVVTFSGASGRVHVRGHLWLKADSKNFQAIFTILTGGFVFDDGGSGHATGPIYTGTRPDPTAFGDCGGVFGNPSLANGDTMLTLTISNDDSNKYFYQLNFLDTNYNPPTAFHTNDPIIVNN